jgi:hypothetical protein
LGDIITWWETEKGQKAKQVFCKRYLNYEENPTKVLAGLLEDSL